tara:strand:+ start:190 stop:522 length:333 start_codon:yes stop_codon:yes gene_type:complete
MSSQIFSISPPLSLLYNFLDEISIKKENQYIYNRYSFKKAQYENKIESFCNTIKDFYYDAKKIYTERKLTYKTFATIIRQICRYHNIPFKSKIKYNKSKHEMEYYIHIQT